MLPMQHLSLEKFDSQIWLANLLENTHEMSLRNQTLLTGSGYLHTAETIWRDHNWMPCDSSDRVAWVFCTKWGLQLVVIFAVRHEDCRSIANLPMRDLELSGQ